VLGHFEGHGTFLKRSNVQPKHEPSGGSWLCPGSGLRMVVVARHSVTVGRRTERAASDAGRNHTPANGKCQREDEERLLRDCKPAAVFYGVPHVSDVDAQRTDTSCDDDADEEADYGHGR